MGPCARLGFRFVSRAYFNAQAFVITFIFNMFKMIKVLLSYCSLTLWLKEYDRDKRSLSTSPIDTEQANTFIFSRNLGDVGGWVFTAIIMSA